MAAVNSRFSAADKKYMIPIIIICSILVAIILANLIDEKSDIKNINSKIREFESNKAYEGYDYYKRLDNIYDLLIKRIDDVKNFANDIGIMRAKEIRDLRDRVKSLESFIGVELAPKQIPDPYELPKLITVYEHKKINKNKK